jgi:hypothetical protein
MPAKLVQIRRGTTADHSIFIGKQGEITADLNKNTIVVHDETIPGGHPLAKEDMSNVIGQVGVPQLDINTIPVTGEVLSIDINGELLFSNSPDISNAIIGGDFSGTVGNAQLNPNSVTVIELDVDEGTNGQALLTDGAGQLFFGDVITDPTLGGDLSGTTSNAQINPNTVGALEIAANSVSITELNVVDGTDGQILSRNVSGGLEFVDPPDGGFETGTFVEDILIGDSTTTTFILSEPVIQEESIIVSIDGVTQPTASYALPTPTSIDFTNSPPDSGATIRVLHLGVPVPIGQIGVGGDTEGDILYHNGTAYTRLPKGTAAQVLTMNTNETAPFWGPGGAGGPSLGTDHIIRTNAKNISENIVFAGTENGMTAGPITVDEGFSVTVTQGSTWTIL